MRTIGPLVFILLVNLFATSALAQQAGDKIVVITDNAPLRSRDATNGLVAKGTTFVIKNVNGNWYWVIDSNGHETVKGWINRSDVIPLSQALDFFNEALKRNPTARAYVIRGSISYEKEEYDKAIADYSQAIRLNPKDANAYIGRGDAWSDKGQYDAAISDFTNAVRLDPKSANARLSRGGAWLNKGELDKAIADFNDAVRLDPKNANAYLVRAATWINKSEYDKALVDFNEAIRLDPKDPTAYEVRGMAWFSSARYDRAISDFNEALRLNPKNVQLYSDRGNAWLGKSEYDKALADYDEAIRLDPKNARLYADRSNAWLVKNETDKAIADCSEAIRLNPQSASAWNARAWLEANCIDPKYRNGKQAVADATKACEVTTWHDPGYLSTLAAAYAETGDFASAEKWQGRAIGLASEPLKSKLRARLDLYRARKPYRQ